MDKPYIQRSSPLLCTHNVLFDSHCGYTYIQQVLLTVTVDTQYREWVLFDSHCGHTIHTVGTTDSHCGHTIHRVGTESETPQQKTSSRCVPFIGSSSAAGTMHIMLFLLTPGGQRIMTVSILCLATVYAASGGRSNSPSSRYFIRGRSNSPSSLYSREAGSWSSCGSWPLVDTGMLRGILQHRQHPHLCQHCYFFWNLFQSPVHQLMADCFIPHYI